MVRIAVWQAPGRPQGREARLGELRRAALEAAAQGAELMLTPELALAGAVQPAALAGLAEPSDGAGPRAVGDIAAEAGIALAVGYPELCSGRVYSALLVVDSDGHSLAGYRRAHVRSGEAPALACGQWLTVVPFQGRRLGLLLGYDLAFPEAARGLVLSGADLLVAAGGSCWGPPGTLEVLLPARALENRTPVAHASFAAAAPGSAAPSRVLDGEGRMLAQSGEGPGLLVADLPPPAAGRDLDDRRPRLYQRLAMVDAVAGSAASSS